MSYTSIYDSLVEQLQTVTGLPPLLEENKRISGGQAWVRATLLPAQPIPESIGVSGYDRLRGLLQVDVFYPVGTGNQASTMADAIIAAFSSRGLQLDNVTVERAWREAGSTIENYYSLPVFVRWRAYL